VLPQLCHLNSDVGGNCRMKLFKLALPALLLLSYKTPVLGAN
jgi:hypothetical protein